MNHNAELSLEQQTTCCSYRFQIRSSNSHHYTVVTSPLDVFRLKCFFFVFLNHGTPSPKVVGKIGQFLFWNHSGCTTSLYQGHTWYMIFFFFQVSVAVLFCSHNQVLGEAPRLRKPQKLKKGMHLYRSTHRNKKKKERASKTQLASSNISPPVEPRNPSLY